MTDFKDSKPKDQLPVNPTVSEVGGSANKMMQDSIRRNQEFNNRLEMQKAGRLAVPEVPSYMTEDYHSKKLDKIDQVLKNKGMDSQQRQQSIELIRDILKAG